MMNEENQDPVRTEAPKIKLRKAKRHFRWTKSVLLFIAAAAVILGIAGGSIAYIIAQDGPIENKFDYAKVSCAVQETFKNNVKTDVQIKNTGNIDAYIRAAIIVTWQDGVGNVYPQMPVEGTDYNIIIDKSNWFKASDGYYYCKSPVAANGLTPILITSCAPIDDKNPENYTLSVEILADAIQSVPAAAVNDSWGVTVNPNGTISE